MNIYVPKRLPVDHQLVALLGWKTARRLCDYFGGEILQPSNCRFIERDFRNRTIIDRFSDGMSTTEIAADLEISCRTVRHIVQTAKTPVAISADNDNDPASNKPGQI